MRRFFNRLSKALLVFALSVGAAGAAERPSPFGTNVAPSTSATVDDSMREEDANVADLLERIGFEFKSVDNTAGNKSFFITSSRGGLDYQIRISVSGNGAIVWLNSVVAEIENPEAMNPKNYLALLEANSRLSPAIFSYSESEHYVRMSRCFPYEFISAQYLREEIDIHLDTLNDTRDLWDTTKWSAQATVPASYDEESPAPAVAEESQVASAVYGKVLTLSDGVTKSNEAFVAEVARFVNGNDYDMAALRASYDAVVASHVEALDALDAMETDYAGVNDFVAALRSYVESDLNQIETYGADIVLAIEDADAAPRYSRKSALSQARSQIGELAAEMAADNAFISVFEQALIEFVNHYGLSNQTA